MRVGVTEGEVLERRTRDEERKRRRSEEEGEVEDQAGALAWSECCSERGGWREQRKSRGDTRE